MVANAKAACMKEKTGQNMNLMIIYQKRGSELQCKIKQYMAQSTRIGKYVKYPAVLGK